MRGFDLGTLWLRAHYAFALGVLLTFVVGGLFGNVFQHVPGLRLILNSNIWVEFIFFHIIGWVWAYSLGDSIWDAGDDDDEERIRLTVRDDRGKVVHTSNVMIG